MRGNSNPASRVLVSVLATIMVDVGVLGADADTTRDARIPLPTVKVVSVRRVFHNGEHNAFTDLCRFRGQLWLTFRSCPDGHMVHSTAFLFQPDGSVLGVGRRSGNAQLLRAQPPYTNWDRKDLDRAIGGPLLAQWGNRYLIGGRKTTPAGPKTSLCWLVDDQLHEFAELPSGGDTSYPGFVEMSQDRALVSYYSSHERDDLGKPITAIYLAELVLSQ
jgi:hypothetical protein